MRTTWFFSGAVLLLAGAALSCGGGSDTETATGGTGGTSPTGGTSGGGTGGAVVGGAGAAATGGTSGTSTGGSATAGASGSATGGMGGAGMAGAGGGGRANGGASGSGAGRGGASGAAGAGGASGDWTCELFGTDICFCRLGGEAQPETMCAGEWSCCAVSAMNCECFNVSEEDCLATIATDSRLSRTPACPP